MEKIIRMIKEKQIFCFFLLAFLISWVIWAIAPLISENAEVQQLINLIGSFGPAMAAIIVAGTIGINNQAVPSLRYWVTFGISFIVIYTINILSMNVLGYPEESITYFLMGIISILATIVLTGPLSKNRGIRRLLRYIKKAKVSVLWYLIVIFYVPLITLISLLIDVYLLGNNMVLYTDPWYEFIYTRLITFLAITIYGGSLNEEPGWRGFALHRLITKFNPLVASLILSLFVSLWSAPLHFNGFYEGGFISFIGNFVWNIPLTIIFTWVYIKTKGSLLHVVLLHTGFNTIGLFIPSSDSSSSIFVLFLILTALIVTIKNRMWKKRDTLMPFKNMQLF